MTRFSKLFRLALLSCCITMGGCNGSSPQPEAPKTADTVPVGEPVVEAPKPVNRPPVIHITDTVDTKRMVLCVRDSAAVYERIAPKLGEIYLVRIGALIGKSGVRITGKPMAWFTRKDGAFFFEAGFPVDKKPAKLPPQFLIRETKSDSITMAHFYGPYPLVSEGYTALEEYLLNNGRSAKGQPYELYVDDPVDSTGKPKDPWKVRTDIVFPWK